MNEEETLFGQETNQEINQEISQEINQEINRKDQDFLTLFYQILFKPKESFVLIRDLRENKSEKLFFYAVVSLSLASFGLASWKSNPWLALLFLFVWFWNVSTIVVFSWLFSQREREDLRQIDFGLFFLLSALSQSPLVFLGICQLWLEKLGISILSSQSFL